MHAGYFTSNIFAIAKISGLFLIIAIGLGFIGIVGPGNLEVRKLPVVQLHT